MERPEVKRTRPPLLRAVQPSAPPEARADLPQEAGRLVGRGADLVALRRLLAGERLVTLLGPPGVGKSRIALRLAHELAFAGVHFVDLGAAATLEAAVAEALGGAGAVEEALARLGPTTLLLDGADRLAPGAAPVIERWLAAAPGLRCLVTSSVRLGAAGEVCHDLPPLAREEAVELYEEVAGRIGAAPGRHGDRAVIEQLVDRLDLLPLAIELAAARSRVLRPRQLLARIDEGIEVLRARGRSGRHATLVDALRASWELLSPAEQDALARCTVFVGSFTLEAAEAILERRPCAPPIVDLLEALRDRSLLQLAPCEPPRFHLLQTVRAFAGAELERRGLADEVRSRHAAHYVAACESESDGVHGSVPLAMVVAERENLLAAHRASLAAAPALAARAALLLAPLLAMQGPPALEAEVLEAGIDAARRAGSPLLLARALRPWAVLLVRSGRLEEAREALTACSEGARAAGNRLLETHAAIELGRLHFAAGAFEEATAVLVAAREDARACGWRFLEGYAWNFLGMVAEAKGDLPASATAFEAAIDRFRIAESRRYEGLALMNLGVTRAALGYLAHAAGLFEQSIAAMREVADRAGEADAVLNLGCVHLSAGRLDDAEPLLRRALHLERACENGRAEALALGNLGIAAHERGELRTARELLHEAIERCRSSNERHFRCSLLPFRGAVEATLGNLAEARGDFDEARRYFEGLGDRGFLRTVEVCEVFLSLADDHVDLRAAQALLDEPVAAIRSTELRMAMRLATRALALRRGAPSSSAAAPEGQPAIEVGPEAAWFRIPGGEKVDLRRRKAQRLIVRALVEQRLAAPGVGLSVEQIFAAGWQGTRALPSAAAARVYVAIGSLRSLGLGELLLRQDDGYLIDPRHPVRRVAAR